MADVKLMKHYSEFEVFLNKAKSVFNKRWTGTLQPNARMSEFLRIRTLGTGSFGRVMLVRHLPTKQALALKIMEKEHIVKMKQVAHTISEIKILDAIHFEFLVGSDYYFKDNVYLFISMPFVNGGEMFTHLRQMKKFDEGLTKFYASQVILALEYLHYLGLIYRDLKPENIIMDCDGYLKITDLGFCKKIDESRTYTLCGTPEYLAPEVILSKGYNYAVDWWACGVLIYEMSAGYPPFCARDPLRIYEKIVSGRFNSPSHFSKSLRELLPHMLQVDRSKRYGNLRNGSRDIKGHDWFKSLDWDSVLHRKVKPSFVPKVSGPEDTSNFDSYDEQDLRISPINEYAEEFREISLKRISNDRED